jgi:hypothetical protein
MHFPAVWRAKSHRFPRRYAPNRALIFAELFGVRPKESLFSAQNGPTPRTNRKLKVLVTAFSRGEPNKQRIAPLRSTSIRVKAQTKAHQFRRRRDKQMF